MNADDHPFQNAPYNLINVPAGLSQLNRLVIASHVQAAGDLIHIDAHAPQLLAQLEGHFKRTCFLPAFRRGRVADQVQTRIYIRVHSGGFGFLFKLLPFLLGQPETDDVKAFFFG